MGEAIHVSIEGMGTADARRAATERAREAAVLELYRLGEIGSGRAAQELGLARVDFLDLAARHGIPTIQITAAELEEEVTSLDP